MKSKENKTNNRNKKNRSNIRERRRRKQFKQKPKTGINSNNFLNQHLDFSKFKKVCCDNKEPHDIFTCFGFHNNSDFIRDLNENYYLPEMCPTDCRDPFCSYSHNFFEKHYHPILYKKVFCKSMFDQNENGEIKIKKDFICEKGEICPFAHNQEEIQTELLFNHTIDNDFLMFKFKMEQCPLSCIPHDKSKCLFSHDKNDHRRDPIFFSHSIRLCKSVPKESHSQLISILKLLILKIKFYSEDEINILKFNLNFLNEPYSDFKCQNNIDCTKCHNVFEFLYHPRVFKALNCSEISSILNKKKKKDAVFSLVDTNLNYIKNACSDENDFLDKSSNCDSKLCPFNHQDDTKFENIQKTIETPFYKFPYNRIIPGHFFAGTSFFNSKSENMVTLEDRDISLNNYKNSCYMSGNRYMYNQNQPMQYAPHIMNPEKLYYTQGKMVGYMHNNNMNGRQYRPNNKENQNYNGGRDFRQGQVNMNMYKISMNNTFLIPPNQGYQKQQMNNFNGGYGNPGMGYNPYAPQNFNSSNFSPNFYRC